MLPFTSVKTSGSDKHKQSILPATGLVDAESKISSDITIQMVMSDLGTLATRPTYAEVKASQNSAATGSTSSTATSSTSNCTGSTSGFTGSTSVASQLLSTRPHLYPCTGPTREWAGQI